MGAENPVAPRGTERCLRKTTCAFVVAEADLSEFDRNRTQATLSRSRRNVELDEPEEGFDTYVFDCVVRGCDVTVEIIKKHDEVRIHSYAADNMETCQRA